MSKPRSVQQLRLTIIMVIMVWTFLYNFLIKKLSITKSFFKILDTISDDFVIGTLYTIVLGCGIVLVFSFTKLYTQIISNVYSFKILEDLFYDELRAGNVRHFISKLSRFQVQPTPSTIFPSRIGSLLFAFTFLYVISWLYVVVFSEALFFVAWSAGVDLPITPHNLLQLPALALSIPFSARVMAYVKYPYVQDYADFMPGAVFVLLIVATLGYLFQSDDQKFLLAQVWLNKPYLILFIKNGVFLAFIPVFFEASFWIFQLGFSNDTEK
jgi:hypothetical protein